jgi:hypothetical protein
MKSKEEREAQWERIAWRIASRKGWPLQDAAQYLAERAIGFWFSRTAHGFVKGVCGGTSDPYLERAEKYHVLAGASGFGATNLW